MASTPEKSSIKHSITTPVQYDPLPFTATANSLRQHETVMAAFARHREALRRRRAAEAAEASPPSRAWGLLLAFLGVFCVSPDSMLLRSMHGLGASTAAIVAAKYFGVALLLTCVAAAYPSKVKRAFSSLPHLFAAVICNVMISVGFTLVLLLDDPARSLLLIALSPFWSALLGLLVLGDPLPVRTRCALVVSFIAIGIVLAPRFITAQTSSEEINGTIWLDAVAVGTGLALGITFTVYRHASLHAPDANLLLATVPSALLVGVTCLYVPCDAANANATVATLACTPLDVWRSHFFLGLALSDAVLIVIDIFSFLYALKHISGSECALVGLLENILSPLWVFARFGDVPSSWTIAGGAVLLATLVGHELAAGQAVPVSQPGEPGYRTVDNA